ncbi:MAG: hypothetical protein EB101_06590 [Chitinophagia bacterium]|nr:hypothetical protein [Chitinophagia bacterium]
MAKMINPSVSMLTLWGLLKSGKPVDFEDIVKAVGQKRNSVMVLICTMRFDFGAEIETEREGRKVKTYKLLNPDVVAPRMVAKAKPAKVKAVKAVKAVSVKQTKTTTSRKSKVVDESAIEDFGVEEISDTELADLKEQLGI